MPALGPSCDHLPGVSRAMTRSPACCSGHPWRSSRSAPDPSSERRKSAYRTLEPLRYAESPLRPGGTVGPVIGAKALADQLAYYRARAGEYDEWALREGRHDRGDAHRDRWLAEWAGVEETLAALAPYGDVLELAAGTGLWTRLLVPHAASVTAIEGAPEMIAINRARPGHDRVRFVQANLFEDWPVDTFDFIAFGFWLSHVPSDRFDAFFDQVARALRPGGRIWFVDSTLNVESGTRDVGLVRHTDETVRRWLNDGSEYEIVKVFREPVELERRLAALGWDITVAPSAEFFSVGAGRRAIP